MKLLFDQNLSSDLVRRLLDLFPESDHSVIRQEIHASSPTPRNRWRLRDNGVVKSNWRGNRSGARPKTTGCARPGDPWRLIGFDSFRIRAWVALEEDLSPEKASRAAISQLEVMMMEPSQPPQRNADSRPTSIGCPASGTPPHSARVADREATEPPKPRYAVDSRGQFQTSGGR